MNSELNNKLDFVFTITPNALLKHNNYIYQKMKTDNCFVEILIYDYNDPLNSVKNYFFTIKKILKIAILRKYTNIMIIYSNILLRNDWIKIVNEIIEKESQTNNLGLIWLDSEQHYFTKDQLDEINTKQYYTHKLTCNDDNKLTITYGTNGLIISKNIFLDLYKLINENLNSNNLDSLNECLSYACSNTNSYIIYPNVLITIDKLKPLYNQLEKIKKSKETKLNYSRMNANNMYFKNLMHKSKSSEESNTSDIISFDTIKKMITNDVISELQTSNFKKILNDFLIPFLNYNSIYNPNYFNVYFNFTKEVLQHFDWIFYKYFYEDSITNERLESYEDSVSHYLLHGYKELRYFCIDDYLYDKNDAELEINIKLLNIEEYYNENKDKIDQHNLSIKPIIYYIKYDYKINSQCSV